MTRAAQKTLFTALAFVAVVLKGVDTKKRDAANQVLDLAILIEAFCAEHGTGPLAMLSANGASENDIDRAIERHVRDLREKEQTRLPDGKEVLIRLYDRLQQRKSRRMQREFYASASEAKLADLVLRYLDEEIDDSSKEALT